jgi:hypothetical protein
MAIICVIVAIVKVVVPSRGELYKKAGLNITIARTLIFKFIISLKALRL